ncbi:MAG: TRAP transporter small permease subunit [Rectinema sp.]|nr:TRAP transporter small permease subunit [Rectinema sp.]
MTDERSALQIVRRLSEFLDRIVSMLCALMFGAMTLDVIIGVFFRFVLRNPLNFTEELARYLMIWGASIAISLGISAGEHVGLTVILDSLKNIKAKKFLLIIINSLVLLFLLFMLLYSLLTTLEARNQFSTGLGITMVLPKLAIPVAMLFSIVQIVLVTIMILADQDGKLKTSASGYIDI